MLIFPFADYNQSTYIFLGMAGVFACVMNAPVTAIFLVAEITQSYQLFVPLMIVCAVSYFLKYYWENLRKNVVQTKEQGKAYRVDRIILNQLRVRDLVEEDDATIKEDTPFRAIVEKFSHSSKDMLQVVDADKNLKGIISLNDIRLKLGDTSQYDTLFAKNLMQSPEITADIDEAASEVLSKFDEYKLWSLPVVSGSRSLGFISQSKLLTEYRNELTKTNKFF